MLRYQSCTTLLLSKLGDYLWMSYLDSAPSSHLSETCTVSTLNLGRDGVILFAVFFLFPRLASRENFYFIFYLDTILELQESNPVVCSLCQIWPMVSMHDSAHHMSYLTSKKKQRCTGMLIFGTMLTISRCTSESCNMEALPSLSRTHGGSLLSVSCMLSIGTLRGTLGSSLIGWFQLSLIPLLRLHVHFNP